MLAAMLAASGCAQEASSEAKPGKAKRRPHLVELAAVALDTLRSTSVYTGSLRYRHSVRIFNQEEGRVLVIPWYEGDHVRAGDVLFELDATLLSAELKKARAVRRETEANLKRVNRLLERRMVSEEQTLRASAGYG